MEQQTQTIQERSFNLVDLKSMLANLNFLKWIRKFKADNLQENCELAEKFEVETKENSIAIMDDTQTKMLFTNSKYKGKIHTRFQMTQLNEIIKLLGSEGVLIITPEENGNLIVEKGEDTIVISSTAKSD